MTFEKTTRGLFPKKYLRKIKEWLISRYGNEEGN